MRFARYRSVDRCAGMPLAWALACVLVIAGAAMAIATVAAGHATVLYTFYPPLLGSPFYYLGILIAVIGSWIWIGLMVWHFRRWKADHPGLPVPLAMFATTVGALLWGWTSLGVGAEIVFLILPNAFGWTPTIDPGLARLLFSWTLHAIVYFWLIPTYISFYVLLPQAAGGRLYSDKMGRIAFLQLLIFSMPIGIHHLFVDPQIGAGFKFLHAVFTGMVAVPTLLTIFTVCASLEIAGRLRGGRGLFGWIAALPWDRPFVLASAFSLIMLGLGGASGLINMSYVLNSTVHNTQWVTGHFHLIYGGAVVIMYFAIAYELWPRLTGRPLAAPRTRSAAIVDLVCRDGDRHAALASGRCHGTAAAHGLLRFHQCRADFPRRLGQHIGVWWLRSCLLGGAADRRADYVTSRAGRRGDTSSILACAQSSPTPPALPEQLRYMGAAGLGVDHRELRLPAGAVCLPQQNRRAGFSGHR